MALFAEPEAPTRLQLILHVGWGIKVRLESVDPRGKVRASVTLAELPRLIATLEELLKKDSALTRILAPSIGDALIKAADALQPPVNLQETVLPLFAYAEPKGMFTEPWTDYVQNVALENHSGLKVEVVGTAPTVGAVVRPRPELPLRCTALGLDAALALMNVVDNAWFLQNRAVQRYGLNVVSDKYSDWMGETPAPVAHILVMNGECFGWVMDEMKSRPPAPDDPILAIVIGVEELSPPALAEFLRRDIALVRLPVFDITTSARCIQSLLLGIVHDNPLHEAVRTVERLRHPEYAGYPSGPEPEYPPIQPRLFATPAGLNRLRLSSLLAEVKRSADALFAVAGDAPADELIQRLTAQKSSAVVEQFAAMLKAADVARLRHRSAHSVTINFSRESLGLVPMCELIGANENLHSAVTRMRYEAGALLSQHPELAELLEQSQARRVDATIVQRDGEEIVPLNRYQPVPSRASLRLRTFIGQQRQDSLMSNAAPALDPLLPPLPGEEPVKLDFVLFAKDFILRSPSKVSVELPRFGGTKMVEWDIDAPVLDANWKSPSDHWVELAESKGFIATPVAEMRFNVYYRNQLLQSFRVTVLIDRGPPLTGGHFVTIECDFTRTERFTAVEQLPPRELSFLVNYDSSQATHTLMIRGDKVEIPIRWREEQMLKRTEVTRDALFAAIAGTGKDPVDQAPMDLTAFAVLANRRPEIFDEHLRRLADAGNNTYNELFNLFDSLGLKDNALGRIKTEKGLVIQIARTEPSYNFPWPLLYDFNLPAAGMGKKLPVCRGFDAKGCICGCGKDGKSYCIRGFWGLRHVVEQLCQPTPALTERKSVAPPPTTPMVTVVPAYEDDFVRSYLTQLPKLTSISAQVLPPSDDLLAWLRPPQNRTNILVFLGHMDEVDSGGSKVARLVVKENVAYIDHTCIRMEYQDNQPWQPPRPLVMLMACDGAAGRIDGGTSIAAALMRLGAAGVIGAECRVYTSIAVRMARDLKLKLSETHSKEARKLNIGEAMRETVFSLASEGCLGGMAFTHVGPADVHLEISV